MGLVCVSGHVAHGDSAIDEGLPAADAAQVTEVGFKAGKTGFIERLGKISNSLITVTCVDHDFGEQRIIIRAHLGAGGNPAIAARPFGKRGFGEEPAAGAEVVVGVLGINAGLDGMAGECGRTGRHFPCGFQREAGHPLDEVDAGNQFGDAVLDLQAGVHFQKEEVATIRIVDELDGAGGTVLHALTELDGGGMERGAGFFS